MNLYMKASQAVFGRGVFTAASQDAAALYIMAKLSS
jgi:hypothetical protein